MLVSNTIIKTTSERGIYDEYINEVPRGRPALYEQKKTDIGPAHWFRINTRPPLAGPYAFSRIPKSKWNRRRVNLEHAIADTWMFVNLPPTG